MCKLNNTRLKNQWVKDDQKGNQKYVEINENENTTYQNIQDEAREVLKGKLIVIMPTLKFNQTEETFNMSEE